MPFARVSAAGLSLALLACGVEDPVPPTSFDATPSDVGPGDAGFLADAGDAGFDAGVPHFELMVEDVRSGALSEAAPNSFDRVHVTLRDAPNNEVTIVARSGGYRSAATYPSTPGRLEVSAVAPRVGSYDGVDPDGLFWSMTALTSTQAFVGFRTFLTARVGTTTIATTYFDRIWRAPGVIERVPEVPYLVGYLYLPATPGPHPVIMTFGGSEGGVETGRRFALRYVQLGYAAFGIGYFGAPNLPPTLTRIPLEYFESLLAWLSAQPEIDPARIAVHGGSRGGELALLLGATFSIVKAVIADVPSGVSWGAQGAFGQQVASWTQAGVDLPYIQYSGASPGMSIEDGVEVIAYRPIFAADLAAASTTALDRASFRVEDIAGPVMMQGGGDDQLWPSCPLADIAWARLEASGHATRYPDENVCYADVGHFIGVPGLPTTSARKTYNAARSEWWLLGGHPGPMAHAQRDFLGRSVRFLDAAIGPPR